MQILGIPQTREHGRHLQLIQTRIEHSGHVELLRRIHLLAAGLPGFVHPLQGWERINRQRVPHLQTQGLGQ